MAKYDDNITLVMRTITKVYVGQLVEEARRVQIEEQMKQKVEQANGAATPNSDGGDFEMMNDEELGPIEPHHMTEARARLLAKGELTPPKPRAMFKHH